MAKEKTYRIGDACKQLDIQPYVLRYWETEFPPLSPDKSKAGQRLYTEADVSIIRRIKELLYDEGYTIAGAKKKLEAELASGGPARASTASTKQPVERPKPRSTAPRAPAKASATLETEPTADPQVEARLRELQRGHQKLRDGVGKALDEARALLEALAP